MFPAAFAPEQAKLCVFCVEEHWACLSLRPPPQASALYLDGIPARVSCWATVLAEAIASTVGWELEPMSTACLLSQDQPSGCAAVALAHAASVLHGWGLVPMHFGTKMQEALQECGPHFALLCGTGGLNDQQTAQLEQLLVERGVPREEVAARVQQALQKLSPGAIAQALEAKNVWQSLKAIASKPSTMFRWIRQDELELHIQQRASDKFGVTVASPKAKKQGGGRAKASNKPLQVDPLQLQMASGSFVSSGSDHLCQLAFEEVVAEAEGLAFCHASQLAPFLADYRPLSVGALGLLTTSPIPATSCGAAPVSTIRYPALYAPTGEAILLTGTLLQLGDSTVQLASGDIADIENVETGICRVSVYRDELSGEWSSFIQAPVRQVMSLVTELSICRANGCVGDCKRFHPAVEEQVEQVVLDVWNRQFQRLEGGREAPAQASMFSALLRVPMSAVEVLQRTLYKGVYFEPRSGEGSGPHPGFAVIWLPGQDAAAALHTHRTCQHSQALTRLGKKYGVRVRDTDEQQAFGLLRPSQEFVKVKVCMRFRLHPLPFGFQRHSVLQLLRRWKWAAKPLQPCKGDSQGSAWEVGSSVEPPALALPLGEGFVLLTLLRDVKQPRAPAALCASQRTRRSILLDDPDPGLDF